MRNGAVQKSDPRKEVVHQYQYIYGKVSGMRRAGQSRTQRCHGGKMTAARMVEVPHQPLASVDIGDYDLTLSDMTTTKADESWQIAYRAGMKIGNFNANLLLDTGCTYFQVYFHTVGGPEALGLRHRPHDHCHLWPTPVLSVSFANGPETIV